jgi:hypothetical protein
VNNLKRNPRRIAARRRSAQEIDSQKVLGSGDAEF